MRIAKYIDPAVFYDKHAAQPYIMSPYLACVNTLSAWPAPHRQHDAVLALEDGTVLIDSDDEHDETTVGESDVPRELLQHGKSPPTPIRYWSFQGFREDETSNVLQRKPTLEQISESTSENTNEPGKEGSIRSQSTRFDEGRMVTVEHPNHRAALTRLGSFDRASSVRRLSIAGMNPTLQTYEEDLLDEEDESESGDGNESFYTAVEYIIENEVQPDGTVVPVKKKKKGLSVKQVRKSLHIPSAKTVQKNMRGLSIKRKDSTLR